MTPDSADKKPGMGKRLPRIVKLVIVGLLVVIVTAIVVALFITSRPAFFARFHGLTRRYDTLEASAHRDLPCSDCHQTKQGPIVYRAALVGDFFTSLFTKRREPAFIKFEKPTREACLKCHKNDWAMDAKRVAKVPHPAHLKVSDEKRDCVICHKWTAHEEAYMEKHKTMPFSGVCAAYGCHAGFKSEDSCDQCHHSLQATPAEWKTKHPQTVKVIGPNACLETCHDADQCRLCHTTGKMPVFTGLATKTGLEAIEVLHEKDNWIEQHGAQALNDKTKCLVCHVSEGECQDCHAQRPAFHGAEDTWLSAHKELAKDKRRCLACHKEAWCTECHDQFKEMR